MNITGTIIFVLVAFVLIFLILREFFCWYWKINQRVGYQQTMSDMLYQQQKDIVMIKKYLLKSQKMTNLIANEG